MSPEDAKCSCRDENEDRRAPGVDLEDNGSLRDGVLLCVQRRYRLVGAARATAGSHILAMVSNRCSTAGDGFAIGDATEPGQSELVRIPLLRSRVQRGEICFSTPTVGSVGGDMSNGATIRPIPG